MPTLEFKGKQIVYAHHLTVPPRMLETDAKKSLPPKVDNHPPSTTTAPNASPHRSKQTAVVFATHKSMGQRELAAMGITFAQLLYSIN